MKEKGASWWWPLVKIALAAIVLAAVGRQFWIDIGKLDSDRPPIRVEWLAMAAGLYILGMGFCALYWTRLMLGLGAHPAPVAAVRAYYVSQLGKYVPGKALAFVMRAGMIASPVTPASTAALATFVEVLAMMASGALVAVVCALLQPAGAGLNWPALWRFDPEGHDVGRWEMLAMGVALFAVTAGPITPPVFNRLAAGIARPFGAGELPRVGWGAFAEGLLVIAPCWPLLGMGLWCAFAAVGAEAPPLTYLTGAMALAFVAGFVVPISPAGLGVREFVLALLLGGWVAPGVLALAVLLLRLAWTLADCLVAGILYPMPVRAGYPEGQP